MVNPRHVCSSFISLFPCLLFSSSSKYTFQLPYRKKKKKDYLPVVFLVLGFLASGTFFQHLPRVNRPHGACSVPAGPRKPIPATVPAGRGPQVTETSGFCLTISFPWNCRICVPLSPLPSVGVHFIAPLML